MSKATSMAEWLPFCRHALACAILVAASSGMTGPAMAQEAAEKTVGERLREYWHRTIARMESGARAAGDEYHKAREEAARASGPAREKMAEKMEVLGRKWAIAREKLATSAELHMHSLGDEYAALKEKAGKASEPAREKMAEEMHKLHEDWLGARAKTEATLSSNLQASRDEIEQLRQHLAASSESARARMGPRMERFKSEFHKDRDKLVEFLEADLKRTREDMEELGEATSHTARAAREKLSKKYHELAAKLEQLHKENIEDWK